MVVIAWLASAAAVFGFDADRAHSIAYEARALRGAGVVETDRAREARTETPSRYAVDPLHYNERWTSMFGSEVSVSDSVSLFVDYQYDQWAPSSAGGESAFRAWENYRVTIGCSVAY